MTTPETVIHQNGIFFPPITYSNPFEKIKNAIMNIIYIGIKPLEASLQASISKEFLQLPENVQYSTFITTLHLLERLPTRYIPQKIILEVDPENSTTPTIVLKYSHSLSTREENTILKIISQLKYELLTKHDDPSALLTQIVLEYP
ncbi:hypothetical protein APY94_04070 [Thermococcus celericrescens]|uniref:Uncharacterized protein n=1 Tax=Thermococcus celericrescens TaxID=227598 RepID=A0A100XYE8_9EURY|nr:hypothetical protein [Thermococcus celericrescens]KUH33914.1 hypothetical protein APY94_04070 [Thermococcus celericrescens]